MKFGRVLVTTSLVAVLASSLFSGWLTSASSILKPSSAQAANDCKLQSLAPTNPKPTADFVTGTLLAGGYEPREKIEFYAGKSTLFGTAEQNYTCPPVAKMPNVTRSADGRRTDLYFVFDSLVQTADNYLFWFKSANAQGTYGGIVADPTVDPPSFQNLWIVVDNDGQYALVFASAPSPTTDDVIIGSINPVSVGGSTLAKLADFNREVYSKAFNVCETDCSDKKIKEAINKPRTQSVYAAGGSEAPLYAAATKTNTFAVDASGDPVNSDAWIDFWGVKYQSGPVGTGGLLGVKGKRDDCSINAWNVATTSFSNIIIKMVGCIFQSLIESVTSITVGENAPVRAIGCISLKDILVERALAQPRDPEPTINCDGALGSLETELKKDGSTKDSAGNPITSPIYTVWRVSIGIVNIVVILALLAIAFANILHLNINTYAAKKALPGLIIGVIGANASLLIVRFLADVTQAVSYWATNISGSSGISGLVIVDFPNAISGALLPVSTLVAAIAIGTAPLTGGLSIGIILIVAIVAVLYYAFLIIAFFIALFKRIVILYFLIMIAPLAFVAYGVPNFQQYFHKWWENFLRYMFLFPIILFGMAATIILAKAVNASSITTVEQLFSAPGLAATIMILAAASMVLKLPKLITKGAIDAGEMFKKAIGAAPRIAAGAQGLHSFAYGGGYQKLKANAAGLRSNIKGTGRWANLRRGGKTQDELKAISADAHEAARQKRLKYGKENSKRTVGNLKALRGYSTLFGDPDILKKSYEERAKQGQKENFIAAMTRTNRIPGKLRGAAAEAAVAKALATDELKDARTSAEFRDWDDGLGDGHLNAVYDKEKKGNPNLWKAILDAADGDELKAEALRQKFGSIGSEDAMIKFIEKDRDPNGDVLAGGLGIANQWDIHDLMKVSGREKKMTEAAGRVLLTDSQRKGDDGTPLGALEIALKRRLEVDPEKDRGAKNWVPPGGGAGPGGGTGPGGGGSPGGGTGPMGGFDQAAFNSHLDRVVQHLDNLKVSIDDADLTRLANLVPLANTPHTMDVEAMKEALKAVTQPEFHDKINDVNLSPDDLAAMVHEFSIAAASGGSIETIRRQLAGSHVMGGLIDRQSQDIGSRLNEEQLGEIMGASFEQAMAKANETLGPNIAKMNEAISQAGLAAKDQTAVLQRVVTELQGMRNSITGKGPNSLLTISKNMGPMIAKAMDVGHMSTLQAIKEASAASQAKTVEAGQVTGDSSQSSQQPPAPAEPKDSAVPTPGYEPPASKPEDSTKP